MYAIRSYYEAFGGPFSFIVAMLTESFLETRPREAGAFREALEEAVTFLNTRPEESARILGEIYGVDPDRLKTDLFREGMEYTTRVSGVETFSAFMARTGSYNFV